MSLQKRSSQPEYFDTPGLSQAQRELVYSELDRLNRLFFLSHTFVSRIPRWLGPENCAQLRILDVGAGTGFLGHRLSAWAARRGWQWQVINLDLNPLPMHARYPGEFVAGSALDIPFADNSFDLVIASQMTHHLDDEEVVRHWREAWRVTRNGVFICDLHRNLGFYAVLALILPLLLRDPRIRNDGLISVARGFRRAEWRKLAEQAGLPGAEVSVCYGTRITLQARKPVR